MRTRRGVKTVLFVSALVGYLIVGYWLQVRNGYILGDSLSRVSAAQSVLYSRQPHVAAIGFIFTPPLLGYIAQTVDLRAAMGVVVVATFGIVAVGALAPRDRGPRR